MASFFEKLKKGMGIDELESPVEEVEKVEEAEESPEPVKVVPKKTKTTEKTKSKKKSEVKKEVEPEPEPKTEPKIEKIEKEESAEEKKDKWPELNGEEEGQLAVDVYQTAKDLVIQSAIAGVEIGNLNISIEKDIVTIKGWRGKQNEETGDYFTQECHWGPFSREVILPVEVDPGRIEATMKEGILTVRIPKIIREKKMKISIKNI